MGGIPIFSDFVMALEGRHEMEGIILVGATNGKVINNQGEAKVMGVMLPKSWGERAGVVAMWEQKLLELVIGLLVAAHTCPSEFLHRHGHGGQMHGGHSGP